MANENVRLESLDACRGFDMLFIMGGAGIVTALCTCFGFGTDCWLAMQMHHVPWHGLAFMDTIFPTFLFIAGVAFPFSCAKQRANGMSERSIALRALRRGVTLFVLGLVFGSLFCFDFAHQRVWSVLGRIGIAWMVAAWLYQAFSVKKRIILALAILLGWILFMNFVPAPDAAAGVDPFSAEGNFGCWLDRALTKGHLYKPLFDPEGFAGILPAVVTAMLGTFAGEIVRKDGLRATGKKALGVFALAGASLALGLALVPVCPINKALWSSTFTLVVGAYSAALFAFFYWLVDVCGKGRWVFFFKVIGMNSITIYFAQRIIGFRGANQFFFNGLARQFAEPVSSLVLAIGYVLVCWAFLFFLYRRKIFLKV